MDNCKSPHKVVVERQGRACPMKKGRYVAQRRWLGIRSGIKFCVNRAEYLAKRQSPKPENRREKAGRRPKIFGVVERIGQFGEAGGSSARKSARKWGGRVSNGGNVFDES